MHVAWKGRFRPGPGRPPITLARVIAQVASRLGGAPRFRMRLAYPAGGFAGSLLDRLVKTRHAGSDIVAAEPLPLQGSENATRRLPEGAPCWRSAATRRC